MKLVETIKDRCHECYACVRNCPSKAVRVKNGQAEVIQDRCINCANCVKICSQGAKRVKKYNDKISQLLESDRKIVVGLAPSFPAFTPEASFADWENYLLEIGFDDVYEVAWGARLMIDKYKDYLQNNEFTVLSSACPVIVNYIEKYYPELVPNLAPIVSPMGALVEYIDRVEKEGTNIVLIGPCHAKKSEFATDDRVAAVMTYTEIMELGRTISIEIKSSGKNREEIKTTEPGEKARRIPLAGGLKEALQPTAKDDNFIRVEGSEKLFELFELISKDEIHPFFVDALFCQGCISGVDLWEKSYFKKKEALSSFIQTHSSGDRHEYRPELISELDLSRQFEPDFQQLPQPDEEEIWEILNKTNKYGEDDLLNCGACGYNSCRKKAIAVYQGLAEVTMCLPYLLTEKRSEIKKVHELNRELDSLINSSYDGMIVVDGEGRVERVNDSYLEMIGLSRDKVIDRAITELEDKRIIYPSVSLLSLREKRNITIVQQTGNGRKILV
ncbi:MAG: [Fe-Fe] hydrogenase large subunit C-terminal domain-containing protein, partial [Halanaerobiales bacterium]